MECVQSMECVHKYTITSVIRQNDIVIEIYLDHGCRYYFINWNGKYTMGSSGIRGTRVILLPEAGIHIADSAVLKPLPEQELGV